MSSVTLTKAGILENVKPVTQSDPEQYLRYLADGTLLPLLVFRAIRNRKGQVTEMVCTLANQPAEGLLDTPLDRLLGRKLTELLVVARASNGAASAPLAPYAAALENNQPLDGPLLLLTGAARATPVRQRVTPLDDGVLVVLQPDILPQPDATADPTQELAAHLTEAFFALDPRGQFTLYNPAAEKLLGVAAAQALGKPTAAVFPDWAGTGTERLFEDTQRTQRPQTTVGEYRVGDRVALLEMRALPARAGLHVFVRDLTQRKRSEEALRVSKAHLSQLLDQVSEVVFNYRVTADAAFSFDYFSPAAAQLWGYTPALLLGNKYLLVSRALPDHQDRVSEALFESVRNAVVVTVEYPFLHGDGTVRWAHLRLMPYRATPELVVVTGVATDITHRHADPLAPALVPPASPLHNDLESLVNAIPNALYVVAREGLQITFCNHAFAQSLGYANCEALPGRTIFECFSAAEAQQFMQQSRQVFSDGRPVRTTEARTVDNHTRHFDTFKVPLVRADGEIDGLLCIAHDVTELVNARQTLWQQTGELEVTNEELEAFTYSVSHDLRAPLRAVDGYTRILLEDYGERLDDEGRRVIDVITNNAKKMGQLIDDLLDFSRLGRKELVRLEFDTRQVVEALLTDLKRQVPDRTIAFDVGPLPPSRGDVNMLRQVWINLLSNAIKYSRNEPRAHITIDSVSTEAENIFVVKDNGVGFDMQYGDKLFGVFQRLHTDEEFEGTGVGLAIVQRIVVRHGGRVWAESESGQGAAFYFSLPTGR